jgi:hypothetical protein
MVSVENFISTTRLDTARILNLPSDVPQTFRTIRRKLRNKASQRKGQIFKDESRFFHPAGQSM